MGKSTVPLPESITASEFESYLGKYPACIEAISNSKGAKAGQSALVDLDHYRYHEAVQLYGSGKDAPSMELDEVKRLVEWKLRHGTFRPSLMKLVSSNPPDVVKDTIEKAISLYRDKSDVSGALQILTQLKGIGPATASLLLAVHDADNIIFFADEAFYWLCCNGSKGPIKYNAKEYIALTERAQVVAKRLSVNAVDVERVAFVLMRQQSDGEGLTTGAETKVAISAKNTKPAAAKRKISDEKADTKTPTRRSKRGKQA